ncbi:hypothetical protein [Lysinibacter cavernae]|uniref:Uncharacterized protein n=1 Tax=Lysinibacter cavernae TaxID=1640652 RepID=A0A7X5QZF6_9MICO|nr:hypothetical protein [Lysinibacter cavernae]NIH52622.1 hypothetical protein [Lysinibacter cavernae]
MSLTPPHCPTPRRRFALGTAVIASTVSVLGLSACGSASQTPLEYVQGHWTCDQTAKDGTPQGSHYIYVADNSWVTFIDGTVDGAKKIQYKLSEKSNSNFIQATTENGEPGWFMNFPASLPDDGVEFGVSATDEGGNLWGDFIGHRDGDTITMTVSALDDATWTCSRDD